MMAGRHHSGRRGQTVRSATGRDLRSTLEARRTADADLRGAVYVRPHGLRFHVVRNICNNQSYVVADASGQTYSPGQSVLLGSRSGAAGEVLMSRPPAGMVGASGYSISPVSARAGYVASETQIPDGLLLSRNVVTDAMRLSWYLGGGWASDVGVGVAAGPGPATWTHIVDGRYGVGYNGDDAVVTWDSITDTYYYYTAPTGTSIVVGLWPVAGGSGVTWVEVSESAGAPNYEITFTRRAASIDLALVSTLATGTLNSPAGPPAPWRLLVGGTNGRTGLRSASGEIMVQAYWLKLGTGDASGDVGCVSSPSFGFYATGNIYGGSPPPTERLAIISSSGDAVPDAGYVVSVATPYPLRWAMQPELAITQLSGLASPPPGAESAIPRFYGSGKVLTYDPTLSPFVHMGSMLLPSPWASMALGPVPGGVWLGVVYQPV